MTQAYAPCAVELGGKEMKRRTIQRRSHLQKAFSRSNQYMKKYVPFAHIKPCAKTRPLLSVNSKGYSPL